LRSIGAQKNSLFFLFIGFNLFGLPIGISLLLKTPLKSYGFYIGTIIGCTVLIILQYNYILRINWQYEAEKVQKKKKN
jgi:Na+-driven multidrug efflux pump